MDLPPKSRPPLGEQTSAVNKVLPEAVEVETYAGKLQIEWDPDAAVTPIGQLPFFIQFLKLSDRVNTKLLGINKVVSYDSARRALHKMDEHQGISWLQDHLTSCYAPLLKTSWILDADVTVKPLCGHQEGAEIGYNPHKPSRPSHTFHTCMIGNLRLVLDV